MAQSTVFNGVGLSDPGTYVVENVAPSTNNTSAGGVITIVGEADQGPGWEDEANLLNNAFTPSQYQNVLQKYVSGNIVEAFRASLAASNDSNINGAPSLIYIVKTNRSSAAAGSVSRVGFGSFANLTADLRGANGNTINWNSQAAIAESAPASGPVTFAPQVSGDISFSVMVNGTGLENITVLPKTSPLALCAQIENTSIGVSAQGGAEAVPLTGLSGIAITASAPAANQLVIQIASGSLWNPAPAIGDTLVIPAAGDYSVIASSVIAGAGSANVGSYLVTGVVNTASLASITCLRITPGTCVAASSTVSAAVEDILVWSPINILNITGMNREANVGISGQYSILSNDGTNVVIQLPAGKVWNAQPKVGDNLVVPASFGGLTSGFYEVASSSSNTVSFYRVSNGTAGTTAAPANIVSPIVAGSEPFNVLKPAIDGLGKSLEIGGNIESILINSVTGAGAGLSNQLLVSAAEYENAFTIAQGSNSNTYDAGGQIALEVGYAGASANVVIGLTGINFNVSNVLAFSAAYAQYPTLSVLINFINSQTGWKASLGSSQLANLSPSQLDQGTFGAGSEIEAEPARIKHDASSWAAAVGASPILSVALVGQAGLPDIQSVNQFLGGGAKAGTASQDVVNAIDACDQIPTNMIVTLFSQDASKDIAAGLTDPSSTYTIDALNQYLQSDVIEQSSLISRANRIGFCSKLDTYANVKEAAGNLQDYRISLTFQSVIRGNSQGKTQQFQPWMAAMIAASMQAAAGYRGIVKKFANVSGVLVASNDFNPGNYGDRVDALKSGLLFMQPVATGGFRWVSDQTTYTSDNNFVYNSIQAVYISDLIVLDLIDTFDRAVVGQSVADITASAALGVLATNMFNYLRLKWISPSNGAPQGYQNASAQLIGGVLQLNVEIFLSGIIYFVPITLNISQVSQTATSNA